MSQVRLSPKATSIIYPICQAALHRKLLSELHSSDEFAARTEESRVPKHGTRFERREDAEGVEGHIALPTGRSAADVEVQGGGVISNGDRK
ncbi:hypothetical protein [Alicyclobacillus mengziensis]|uniref:Uncharacterized protein n=1 Tax=Alicyclobacillus mengziensis TaxID=2931921 RepID=A0A9X7W024_9BACL|nr:hypothetical protein [Alicyclobacillus mengziensis]QSO48238.1 hypothetical protein JZ786_04370 [Alicyclobacillus mengziensis]